LDRESRFVGRGDKVPLWRNVLKRFEYGTFGTLKHQPIKMLYILLIVIISKISTIAK